MPNSRRPSHSSIATWPRRWPAPRTNASRFACSSPIPAGPAVADVLELAESLVKTGGAEPEPDDRFQLARIYLVRGDWERCREQMEKLVNGGQPNPLYLAVYVRMLLDHDQLGDAELWLDRLERRLQSGADGPPSTPNCCIAGRNGAKCPTSSPPTSTRRGHRRTRRRPTRSGSAACSSWPDSWNIWAAC